VLLLGFEGKCIRQSRGYKISKQNFDGVAETGGSKAARGIDRMTLHYLVVLHLDISKRSTSSVTTQEYLLGHLARRSGLDIFSRKHGNMNDIYELHHPSAQDKGKKVLSPIWSTLDNL